MILTIRTDKPEAEVGLFAHGSQGVYESWEAHRQLAETIHSKIATILQSVGKDWHDIKGIVCFKGPGSFTGLRIGLSVGNALAYSLHVPIIGSSGDDWIKNGIKDLVNGKDEKTIVPEYGAPVHITEPRK